jgi:hypothetical protein
MNKYSKSMNTRQLFLSARFFENVVTTQGCALESLVVDSLPPLTPKDLVLHGHMDHMTLSDAFVLSGDLCSRTSYNEDMLSKRVRCSIALDSISRWILPRFEQIKDIFPTLPPPAQRCFLNVVARIDVPLLSHPALAEIVATNIFC